MNQFFTGKICPYCLCNSEYVDSAIVYQGRSYGMLYLCKPCDAYVGVHKGTDVALGRLANAELRRWKVEAHNHFDPLWKRKISTGFSKTSSRKAAYKWLSEMLGTSIEETHIGMFDIEQCKKVVEICKPYLK